MDTDGKRWHDALTAFAHCAKAQRASDERSLRPLAPALSPSARLPSPR